MRDGWSGGYSREGQDTFDRIYRKKDVVQTKCCTKCDSDSITADDPICNVCGQINTYIDSDYGLSA